ncbi:MULTISPECIES: hypothetical protein [Bradyrhizobium]|uniref:hypothetical protein n=1 Tax=Bradyrhizobium TaxID=374 RepID=UPI001EDB6D8C|nr:hypothetical protein [Bradyrhizobium zhengyangense]MCG2642699.1 hypothetical protein [Bradyrhizobium zhengyangense]
MSDSAVPKTWEDALNLVLGNAPWILLLVAVERAVEGHFVQAGGALIGCFISLGVAIYWKVFEGLTKPEGRQRLAFVFIAIGAAILATGIYMLASQGSATVDKSQLHVAKQQSAPEQPPLTPSQPLTQKEEEALQGLSVILNSRGPEVIAVSEKLLTGFSPIPQLNLNQKTVFDMRDGLQEISSALHLMENVLYREFIPKNRYYQSELLAALGAPNMNSADVVETPIYRFQQVVSAIHGRMQWATSTADEAKNPAITSRLMDLAYPDIPALKTAKDDFKAWIDSCNSRIEQRKAQK